MANFQFLGAEPLLIDKVIFYTERKTSGGYSFNSEDLHKLINEYAGDWKALRQIVKEIFWICDQGRRPWSLGAERAFLSLASVGSNMLVQLQSAHQVLSETYLFINPLRLVFTLQQAAEHLEKSQDTDYGDQTAIVSVLDDLVSIYTSIFVSWSCDHPDSAKLLSEPEMNYILETADDDEFQLLLESMARTKSTQARKLLVEFSGDEEEPVRQLAKNLISEYF